MKNDNNLRILNLLISFIYEIKAAVAAAKKYDHELKIKI